MVLYIIFGSGKPNNGKQIGEDDDVYQKIDFYNQQ